MIIPDGMLFVAKTKAILFGKDLCRLIEELKMNNGKEINARATAGSYLTYIREMHRRTIVKASQQANIHILNDMLACAEIDYAIALGDEINER